MFFERYKALCERNNVSVTSVTKELGYSTGSMSQWKNGSVPRGDVVVKIAKYFGVSTDYLLIDDDGGGLGSGNAGASLTREGREYLKKLQDLFVFLLDLEAATDARYKELLAKNGVTNELVDKWRHRDFSCMPSKDFLDDAIILYSEYSGNNSNVTAFREATNDFHFETSLHSQKESQLLSAREATDFLKRKLVDSGILISSEVNVESAEELMVRLSSIPRKAN